MSDVGCQILCFEIWSLGFGTYNITDLHSFTRASTSEIQHPTSDIKNKSLFLLFKFR